MLGYDEWRNFETVIQKAITACETSGYARVDHFVEINKMVELGSGAKREISDFMLTRYACYLIAQNGDPSKDQIAFAQTYFALRSRKQEVIELRLREVAPIQTGSFGTAYTKTGAILKTKADILASVKDRLNIIEKSPPLSLDVFAIYGPRTLAIEAPGPAATALFSGSATFLLVPPDAEFEKHFLDLAQAQLTAAATKSIDELAFDEFIPVGYFPGQKATDILKAAFKDTNSLHARLQLASNAPPTDSTVYPLRQAAYEMLKARGDKLDPPPDYSPFFHINFQNYGSGPLDFRDPKTNQHLYEAPPAK